MTAKDMSPKEYMLKTNEESLAIRQRFLEECGDELISAAETMGQCVNKGGKVLIMGNGGSAADAQHMAAEMIGRMLMERRPLPAIALTTDTSNLTAVGNDYGFDQVFLKQVQALARPEDCIIAISTSGNSVNVLKALEHAQKVGASIITVTGRDGGKMKGMGKHSLNASLGTNSSRIQETHLFVVHSLVDLVDQYFLEQHELT